MTKTESEIASTSQQVGRRETADATTFRIAAKAYMCRVVLAASYSHVLNVLDCHHTSYPEESLTKGLPGQQALWATGQTNAKTDARGSAGPLVLFPASQPSPTRTGDTFFCFGLGAAVCRS